MKQEIDQGEGIKRLQEWEYQKRLEMTPRAFYFRRRVNSAIVFSFLFLLTPLFIAGIGLPFLVGALCECVVLVLAFCGIRYAWGQKAPDRTDRIKKLEEENAELNAELDRLIGS